MPREAKPVEKARYKTQLVHVNELHPNPWNPNTHTEKSFASLKESVKNAGFLEENPILARPDDDGYEIASGEHRWKAAKEVGLSEVPVVIKNLSDKEVIRLSVVLNKGRGRIDYFKLSKVLNEDYEPYSRGDKNQAELGKDFGFARSTIADILPIYPRLKKCRRVDTFSNRQLVFLARVKSDKLRELLVERAEERDWSSKTIRKRATRFNRLTSFLNENLEDGEDVLDELISGLGTLIFKYDANALVNEAKTTIASRGKGKENEGGSDEERDKEPPEKRKETEEDKKPKEVEASEEKEPGSEEKKGGGREEKEEKEEGKKEETSGEETVELNGKILHGDILDIASELDDKVECVLTDPPYGVSNPRVHELEGRKDISKDAGDWDHFEGDGYLKFTEKWIGEVSPLIKEGGSILIFTSDVFLSYIIRILREKGFKDRKTIVWHKKNPVPSVDQDNFVSSVEYIVYATKGEPETFNWLGQSESHNLIECGVANETDHPTEKPVPLLKKLLKFVTNPKDTVLDPFLGSGSTAVACEKEGRKWIGVDKKRDFVELARARVRREAETVG